MIEPKLRGDEKWLPASQSLGSGDENLFFHADMAEKPCSKLSIRALIDRAGMSHSLLEQRFKTPVVFHKKIRNRSCLFVLSWFHPLPPITLLNI
jgi:AraC-like DNA-binding protein